MNTDKIYANKLILEYSTLTSRKAKALKRLDNWIKKPAKITGIIVGLLSIFIFIVGFIIRFSLLGLLAIIGIIANPFIFTIILHKRKKQYANDILLLAQDVNDK